MKELHRPDGYNGREDDEEPENVDVPQSPEAIECHQNQRQRKRNSAQNLDLRM